MEGSPRFDAQHKLVTSPVFSPNTLGVFRFLFGFYALFSSVFIITWSGVKHQEADRYLTYFTHLSFIGLCAYFWAAGVQTLFYSTNGGKYYPLQNWPTVLQYIHVLLYSTIVTYPFLVTIVYWALLASSSSFGTPYLSWSNISQHILNIFFSLFEICLTNVGPMPWLHLLISVILLGSYLGIAYITHETLGFYPYSFLDPEKQGALLVAYIIGIAVGQSSIFVGARGAIVLRERLVSRRTRPADIETSGNGNEKS